MPRKLPLYVERWRDRHGRVRVYFRRGKGPRIPLPTLGAPEFDEAYRAALLDLCVPLPSARNAPGTIAALIVSYLKTPQYVGLRATTKRGYRSRLEYLRRVHGHRLVAGLTRERILGLLQPFAERPGAALSLLKMLRVVIAHGRTIGWLTHDPSQGIKRPRTQEVHAWTEREIAQFERRWPLGSKERTAFALMLYTGQRRADVHRMTWADVTGATIRLVQQKTGRKLTLPLHTALRDVLAHASRNHLSILTTAYGRAFSVDGFSQFMRAAISAAGLPLACQPHGLRKAAGRRLAEAGCSAHEIMAVLGHQSLTEAERYTRDADQARLARDALIKLEGQSANNDAQTARLGLGNNSKSDRE